MRIYSDTQENMIYLSPYTIVHIDETILRIHSTLFETTVMLSCKAQQAQDLLALLQHGVEEKILSEFFRVVIPEIPVRQLLDEWMRKGVLE